MTGARPHGELSPAPPGREPEPGLDAMILDADSPRPLVALGEAARIRVATTGPDPGKDRVNVMRRSRRVSSPLSPTRRAAGDCVGRGVAESGLAPEAIREPCREKAH